MSGNFGESSEKRDKLVIKGTLDINIESIMMIV